MSSNVMHAHTQFKDCTPNISITRLVFSYNYVQSAISHIVTCCVAHVCCSVIRQEERKPGNLLTRADLAKKSRNAHS